MSGRIFDEGLASGLTGLRKRRGLWAAPRSAVVGAYTSVVGGDTGREGYVQILQGHRQSSCGVHAHTDDRGL